MFVSHFPKCFKEIKDATKPGEKTAGSTSIRLPSHDVQVTEFAKCSPKKFCLAEVFQVTLSHGEEMQVVFQEEEVIKARYKDSSFYSAWDANSVLSSTLCMRKPAQRQSHSFVLSRRRRKMEGEGRKSLACVQR